MILCALLLALSGVAHAADPPYYLQDTKGRRDVGGLNENIRSLADASRRAQNDVDDLTSDILGANNTWTGANTFNSTATFNSTNTFTGANTFTATTTFNGNIIVTSGTFNGWPAGQSVSSQTSNRASYTAQIPADDTIPQITEGTQILVSTITPKSATDILRVSVTGTVGMSANGDAIISLFRDSTANAVAAQRIMSASASDTGHAFSLVYRVVANGVVAQNFSVRIGPSTATTVYVGGLTTAFLGATQSIMLEVEEIAP